MDEETDNNKSELEIIQNSDGAFSVSMPATRYLQRKLCRSIESKTKTTIKMPCKTANGNIEVVGSTRYAVESAMNEIEKDIVQKNRRLTHFLSIPIDDDDIAKRFIQFKLPPWMDAPDILIDEYFQKTYKLHLTLGVLALWNEDKKSSALSALQECKGIVDRAKRRFNDAGDLRIKICGVNCMNGNPSKCKILYGMVENDLLQAIANDTVVHFISKGLIDKGHNQVKLHVTLMNMTFVTRITKNRSKTFDASAIVEQFSNYEFGEQIIDQIHLSRFERTSDSSYYPPESIVNISDAIDAVSP